MRLRVQSALALAEAGLGRAPLDGPDGGRADHGEEMLAAGQHDDAGARQARAGQRLEAHLDFIGEREAVARVEAQLGGGGDLVDVLAAGTARGDEGDVELGLVDREGVGDLQAHGAEIEKAEGDVPSPTRTGDAAVGAAAARVAAAAP